MKKESWFYRFLKRIGLIKTYEDDYREYSIARYIASDDGQHWFDNKHGYLAWDGYPGGHGERSYYKAIAWMPFPKLYKDE